MNHDRDVAVYTLAISTVKTVFHSIEADREDPHIALQWAHTLPKEFVGLFQQRQNLALVIVGYYCIVLDAVKEVWWLKGWSKGLFSVILADVDISCRDMLEWPRQMIRFKE